MTQQDIEQKAREIQMDVFKKELRYYVIKRKHLKNGYDEARVKNLLDSLDLPEIECVVVEHDWPMYSDVWYMIHRYVETGKYETLQEIAQEDEIRDSYTRSLEMKLKDRTAFFEQQIAEKDAEIERHKSRVKELESMTLHCTGDCSTPRFD